VASTWLTHTLVGLCAIATLAPFVSTGAWWVRLFDFPKLQLLWASVLPFAIALAHWGIFGEFLWIDALVLLACALWNTRRIAPFTRVWRKESPSLSATPSASAFSLMVANVRVENRRFDEFLERVREESPDLLLVIENDQQWGDALSALHEGYPHRVIENRDEGLGMALYSRLPLRDARSRALVSERRVSIHADVRAGERWVRFVGVHPTPPGLDDDTGESRRDSRVRDAELLLVADEVAANPEKTWIIAGDFNDVAWSHTTRLFKRTSGLVDPRVGRRLLTTYHAQLPLLRYPVDHVFASPGVRVGGLCRARIPGSDHFAVIAAFDPASGQAAQPRQESDDRQDKREMIHEGRCDARSRGTASHVDIVAPGLTDSKLAT